MLSHNKIIRHQIKSDISPNKQLLDLDLSTASHITSWTFLLGSPRNDIINKQQDKNFTQQIKPDSWTIAGPETKLIATRLSCVRIYVIKRWWLSSTAIERKTKEIWPQIGQLERPQRWAEAKGIYSLLESKAKAKKGYAGNQRAVLAIIRRDCGLVVALSLKCRKIWPKNIINIYHVHIHTDNQPYRLCPAPINNLPKIHTHKLPPPLSPLLEQFFHFPLRPYGIKGRSFSTHVKLKCYIRWLLKPSWLWIFDIKNIWDHM